MKEGGLDREERRRLWLRMGVRAGLTVGAMALLLFAGLPLLRLLMPFVLAMVLSWLLDPLVKRLQKRFGASRKLLSALLVLLLVAVVGGGLVALGYGVVSEIVALANDWQGIWAGVTGLLGNVGEWSSRLFELLPPDVEQTVTGLFGEAVTWVQSTASSLLNTAAGWVGDLAMAMPSFAVALVAFVMGAYFITADYPRIREMATSRMSGEVRGFLSQVKRAAVAAFGGYFRAQLILAAVVFFILLVGLLVTGQPYAVLLAFLLAVLDFIPIVGSGTVLVPWAVASLFSRQYVTAVELMVIWGIVALFRQMAEPRIVGNQTGISPILSLMSIYVGMRLAGVPGMILGPMICMVAVNICSLGVFDGVLADLRRAANDVSALLKR